LQMLRSWELVAEEMTERHPEYRADVLDGTIYMLGWLLDRSLRGRRLYDATALAQRLLQVSPRTLATTIANLGLRRPYIAQRRRLRRLARRLLGRSPDPIWRFAIGAPEGGTP
jgi:hypothetical protein